MKSLYTRLFVAFFVVLALSVVGFYQSYRRVSRPNMIQMVGGTQVALANTAGAMLQRGGREETREYMERLDAATHMPHYLIDRQGVDVLSQVNRAEFLPAGARWIAKLAARLA